jgi:hypothetical protein
MLDLLKVADTNVATEAVYVLNNISIISQARRDEILEEKAL